MPTLVHIADAKVSANIARNGILANKGSRVVYFMPVIRDHFISHQWLRELKRGGARTLVGVYFRLADDEQVWSGRYNEPHEQSSLSQAIRKLMGLADPLGFELFIQRKILPKEITRIRRLPQTIGWRYMPHAHGVSLCGCPACLPRGAIKSRALRERLEPVPKAPTFDAIKATLANAKDSDELIDALWPLRSKFRRADPTFMEALLRFEDPAVLEEVAMTLGYFRHPKSRMLLSKLAVSTVPEVRDAAIASLSVLTSGVRTVR